MLTEAILLGLSTGSYCASSCVPLILPPLAAEKSGFKRNAAGLAAFMAGRLAGYLAVGAILGAAGSLALAYVDPAIERRIESWAWLASGAVLVAAGIGMNFPSVKWCARLGRLYGLKRGAFAIGLLSGLNFCPPFFAAASRAFAGHEPGGPSALGGLAYFALFYLGTSVFFLPLLGLPLLERLKGGKAAESLRTVARIATLLLGIYFMVVLGVFRLGA